MIDHIGVQVTDLDKSVAFYTKALAPLGYALITRWEQSAGFGVDGAHTACGVASLSFTSQTNGGAGWTIPASGSPTLSLANSLSMNTNASNACQGASFTVFLKVGP